MPHLVTTVTGRTTDELLRARGAAEDSADLVELRLDGVDRPDVTAALAGRRRPVIVTVRPRWEGGAFEGPETERRQLLLDALAAGAEFVDVEVCADFADELIRSQRGQRIIASRHIFGGGQTDVAGDLRTMRSTGAAVVKLAIEVDSLTATLPLFECAARAGQDAAPGQRHVLIAMGRRGVHTRVLAARLGNAWTYAGDAVAPGQMPPEKLLREFRFRRITSGAALYGVVGDPVGQSLSPAMHNAGFEHFGIDAVYLTFEAKDADDFVTFARAMDVRGGSITAPFKVDLLARMDDCETVASAVGAVNTLTVSGDRWIGANTDVTGFLAPLAGRLELRGARVAVLGAGGAARAIAVGLKEAGALVTICARRPEQARAVADLTGVAAAPLPPEPGSWDVLVNATPPGRKPDDASPMAGVRLDGQLVFDLVYTPADTPLIRQARASGCRTIGGIEMLIAQAQRQFEIWTGQVPPPGLFRDAAEAALADRNGRRA